MSDTYIKPCDVFISWTGADIQIKDDFRRRLCEGGVTVLESDMHCYGNFVDWSHAAATSATVFVAIITENSLSSEGMLWEMEEIHKKLDNPTTREWWSRHIIPVCATEELYRKSEICEDFRKYKISAILMDKSKDVLEELYTQTEDCILSGFCAEYRRNVCEEYIKVAALYSDFEEDSDINFDFTRLYIPRKITCCEDLHPHVSPRIMMQTGQISFLSGAAGSGKSRYINQIHANAENDEIVIALKCTDAAKSDDSLFDLMYRRFRGVCGEKLFFTPESFAKLLSSKKLILVLDGVDEVTTGASTATLAQKTQDYLKTNSTDTAVIFTGRSEKDLNQLVIGDCEIKKYRLDPLDENDIYTLGTTLFVLMGDAEKGEAFYVSLGALDSEIRSNPMLLSQLAAIYNKTGTLPRTIAGILEAVLKITLNLEETKRGGDILPIWREMVENDINDILNRFAYKKYVSLSEGENYTFTELLEEVLGDKYDEDDASITKRTRFLSGWLQKRAIVTEGEFSHKMFLEYFTAVHCYNASFRNRNLKNPDTVKELFSHYSDPYWEAVIKLYLAKADSVIKAEAAHSLFSLIADLGITEYTLLFDACRELVHHRESAQRVFVGDILKKSADLTYPPYGPLFWYVPEYGLYTELMQALALLEANAAAVALVRDVCVLNGHFLAHELMGESTVSIFDSVKGALEGARYGLCELFYTGKTDCSDGYDVYPRIFNLRETKSWMERGCGLLCRMPGPFADSLGLYSHNMYSALNHEYIGIVSDRYNNEEISRNLSSKSCSKLRGLFLSSSKTTIIDYIPFNRGSIRHLFVPENATYLRSDHALHMCTAVKSACCDNGILYFHDRAYIDGTDIIPSGMFADNIDLEHITIGGGVRSIGARAFERCVGLQSIQLPEGLDTIGEKAFFGCDELEEIILPQSLKTIGAWAFFGCRSLSVLNLPDKITEIPDGVFSECRNLKMVNLPEHLESIGRDAFKGCWNISFLNLPDSLRSIGGMAFAQCRRLMNISIPQGVTQLPSYVFGNCDALVGVNLPQSLTEIGSAAFENCRKLKTINLPENLNELGIMAFSGCESLERIELPDNVEFINRAAFDGCVSLRTIKLSPATKAVGHRAFAGCESLTELNFPHGLFDIGCRVFENCTSLRSVTLPDTVETIGVDSFNHEGNVFEGCESLTEISIPDSVMMMGVNVFAGCKNLARVILPKKLMDQQSSYGIPEGAQVECRHIEVELKELIIPDGTTLIPECSYKDDLTISCVVIPEGVTEIGNEAFYGCENLSSVTLPETLTRIGERAFCCCGSLKNIVIPQGVTVIEKNTFEMCSALEAVELKGNVVTLSGNAFEACESLKYINLPDSLLEIGAYAFEDCSSLDGINLPYGVEYLGESAFSGCSTLTEIVIPTAITTIPKGCFFGCASLKKAVLHEGISTIENFAFNNCISLTSLNLPDSLTQLGASAFRRCTSLAELTIPRGITQITRGSFEGCEGLCNVVLHDGVTDIQPLAFCDCLSLENIRMPESLVTIGCSAFSGCESLAEIILPQSLRIIYANAFESCISLRQITIPSGVEALGESLPLNDEYHTSDHGSVFYGCTALERAEILCPVKRLNYRTFTDCTSLKEVILPPTIYKIGDSAFSGCTALESITLPESVTDIGFYAFSDCRSLKKINLPERVNTIRVQTFDGCSSLCEIDLHENISSIDKRAFRNCTSLKQLTLHDGIRRIGTGAFDGCSGLEKVRLSLNFKELAPVILKNIDQSVIEYI